MANTSVSTLVLFIAAISIAAAVAGTLVTTVGNLSGSVAARGDAVAEQVETEFDVISDAGSDAVYDNTTDEITLLVKNTGTTELPTDPEVIDVLVDGAFDPDVSATVVDGDTWQPGNVARVTVVEPLGTGSHRVSVSIRGDRALFVFQV